MCREDGGLIRACIRHARQQAGLDLSRANHWLRFIDICYQRPVAPNADASAAPAGHHGGGAADVVGVSAPEVSVYYVVLAAEALPGHDEWPAAAAAQQAFKHRKAVVEALQKKKVRASLHASLAYCIFAS